MARVRMKVTKTPFVGGEEWVVSEEEAAALVAAGSAERIPDPIEPAAPPTDEDTSDEIEE